MKEAPQPTAAQRRSLDDLALAIEKGDLIEISERLSGSLPFEGSRRDIADLRAWQEVRYMALLPSSPKKDRVQSSARFFKQLSSRTAESAIGAMARVQHGASLIAIDPQGNYEAATSEFKEARAILGSNGPPVEVAFSYFYQTAAEHLKGNQSQAEQTLRQGYEVASSDPTVQAAFAFLTQEIARGASPRPSATAVKRVLVGVDLITRRRLDAYTDLQALGISGASRR